MRSSRSLASAEAIREFWDSKARENPFWYVSSYGPFEGSRDLDAFWRSGEQIWEDLKRAIGYAPSAADRVVEIGCGIGRCTRAIARDVAMVEAFDISEEMLALAGKLALPNVRFHLTRGFDLRPLEDGCADLVLAYCVFQHLPSLQALKSYLDEMVRVSKPGGTIAFTLSPRTLLVYLVPVLRLRAWLREKVRRRGPRGLWRRAWVGIRPSRRTVERLCPIPLAMRRLHGDKWLFFGKRCA